MPVHADLDASRRDMRDNLLAWLELGYREGRWSTLTFTCVAGQRFGPAGAARPRNRKRQLKRQAWNRHKFQTFCLRLHQHSVPRTRLIASVRLARGWRCRKTLVIVRDMQQAVQATWKRLANDDADKLA